MHFLCGIDGRFSPEHAYVGHRSSLPIMSCQQHQVRRKRGAHELFSAHPVVKRALQHLLQLVFVWVQVCIKLLEPLLVLLAARFVWPRSSADALLALQAVAAVARRRTRLAHEAARREARRGLQAEQQRAQAERRQHGSRCHVSVKGNVTTGTEAVSCAA